MAPQQPQQNAPPSSSEVLAYFVRHPEAADTLEGVVRWRLLEERVQRRIEEVRKALGWLVEQELLLTESLPGSEPIFRLNAKKFTQAQRFLNEGAHSNTELKIYHSP